MIMRNTITINGTSSATIEGLLIQTLPPITKPLMRTDIVEIDGRAGDIVTELGYAAYDKSFLIGLYGDYDVDEVIAFFAASGTVTFSNEPDKYYIFKSIAQIDFERLVRYRTAEVTLHVQPYKYPTSETPKTGTTGVNVTNSGNAVAFPRITIEGSGTVGLYLNYEQIFTISLGTSDTITIDCSEMEATGQGVLRNRDVVGNYELFALPHGLSHITTSGTVTSISVSNYKRWI